MSQYNPFHGANHDFISGGELSVPVIDRNGYAIYEWRQRAPASDIWDAVSHRAVRTSVDPAEIYLTGDRSTGLITVGPAAVQATGQGIWRDTLSDMLGIDLCQMNYKYPINPFRGCWNLPRHVETYATTFPIKVGTIIRFGKGAINPDPDKVVAKRRGYKQLFQALLAEASAFQVMLDVESSRKLLVENDMTTTHERITINGNNITGSAMQQFMLACSAKFVGDYALAEDYDGAGYVMSAKMQLPREPDAEQISRSARIIGAIACVADSSSSYYYRSRVVTNKVSLCSIAANYAYFREKSCGIIEEK